MKKRVSLGEFREYCDHHRFRNVAFWSEDQPQFCAGDTQKIQAVFPLMYVCEHPNLVCLRSGENSMLFSKVKYVDISTDAHIPGSIFTLFCGENAKKNTESTYVLFAQ